MKIFLRFVTISVITISLLTAAVSGQKQERNLRTRVNSTYILPYQKNIDIISPSRRTVNVWNQTRSHPIALPQSEKIIEQKIQKGINDVTRRNINGNATVTDFNASLIAGANYIKLAQSGTDGGWDWMLTLPAVTHSVSPSPKNIYGATALGMYYAYLRTNDASYMTSMKNAADVMIADADIRDASALKFLMLYNDLPGVAGTSYKDAAKTKFDARISANGGTATSFAEYIRDKRGITEGYHNGIIGWDLGAWTVSAQMIYDRFGGVYHTDAVDIANVAYNASFITNTNYFDLVRCAGWDETWLTKDYWWYNLGVSGLIDAFHSSGAHANEISGLATKLLNSQASSGGFCGSYGVHTYDEDWQTTAYAMMSLNSVNPNAHSNAIYNGAYYLASTQDACGGWVYSDNTHYPEVGGECTSALFSGKASTVWVDDNYTSSSCGSHVWGYDAFQLIQNGIDAAAPGGTINVYPGNYSETAAGRYLFDATGPYQFGLFFGAGKDALTLQGVDVSGVPVTDYNGVAANVTTNAMNNFGYSGMFVEANNIAVTGLKILPNTAGDNKTIEVIGDRFTVKYCRFDIPPGGGSIYFNDWRFNTSADTSYVKSYRVESNWLDYGTSVDIASGAGYSGSASDRFILNNKFTYSSGAYWSLVSFSGSGTGVPWFVYPVGGAVIQGNQFNGSEQYVRARGNYNNAQFDWASYWNDNSFDKAVVVGSAPPATLTEYSYTSGSYLFNHVRHIGTIIQTEINNGQSDDIVRIKAGTYTEGTPQVVINKNISLIGENKTTTIITPAQNTGSSGDARGWWLVNAGMTFNLSNVTLDGSGKDIFTAIRSNGTGTIDNNIIRNIRYSQYLGMGIMMYGGNFLVSNNTLMNIERIGMYCNGTGVTDGRFIGNTYTGKGNGDWLDYGIEIEKGAVATATGNTITNCTGVAASDGSTSAGMYLTTYFAPGTTGTFTNNIVMNNYVGLEVGYEATDASIAVAHNNVFSGNTGYGIHTTNPFVDATNNYWGSLFGPLDAAGTIELPKSPKPAVSAMKNSLPASALGNAVSENVDYYPWLGSSSSIGSGIWAGGYVNPTANSVFAGIDAAALDGVDLMDVVAPPPPPSDYLYMYFLLAPGQPISHYSFDIKKDESSLAGEAKIWDLRVITDHTASLVTLEFPIAGLPSGFNPVLYDLTTGDFQNLREFPYYTYTSPSSEIASNFELLIGDSTKPAVAVTSPNGGDFLVVGTPSTITWSSSDASGLLAHDVYYSLTGGAPYTFIGSVSGSVHSIPWTPLMASSGASIKVVARDSVLNEQYDISNHTFTILASNSISFSAMAGWNLVSPAMQQTDMTPAGIFGDDYAVPFYTFQYSPSSGYSAPSVLNMGQGYWLGSNSSATVDAIGTPLATASRLLLDGFNIIGNPFPVAMLKDSLKFTSGGITKTMVEAAAAGWLSNVLYGYNGSGYIVESSTLGIWKAYWIPMLSDGITIQYTPGVTVPTPKISPVIAEPTNWKVDLEAILTIQNEKYFDNIASFGVREDATDGFDPMYDAPRPPRSPSNEFIEISFLPDAENHSKLSGSGYARDFKNSANWDFVVANSKEGTIDLRWDNEAIGKLPPDVKIELFDVAAHRVIDMKKVNSYSYDQAGTSRKFTINKIDRVIPAAFELIQNYPNPFNPTTTITYALPFNANVSVQVYDFVGRKVATLIEGRQEAGYHDLSFDASSLGGLSSGLYFYHMVAIGENGKQFSDSKKMMLLK